MYPGKMTWIWQYQSAHSNGSYTLVLPNEVALLERQFWTAKESGKKLLSLYFDGVIIQWRVNRRMICVIS